MVCGEGSAKLKMMVSPAQASAIAWRSDPGPLSFALVTTCGFGHALTSCSAVVTLGSEN
jgi:hypothetical protein